MYYRNITKHCSELHWLHSAAVVYLVVQALSEGDCEALDDLAGVRTSYVQSENLLAVFHIHDSLPRGKKRRREERVRKEEVISSKHFYGRLMTFKNCV